jgi:hypothetical protein
VYFNTGIHEPAVRLDEKEVAFCASRAPACHTAGQRGYDLGAKRRAIEAVSRCKMLALFLLPVATQLSEWYLKLVYINDYDRGRGYPIIKLSFADLSGANLAKIDLTKADLSGANLANADLRNAALRRANLSGANLSGANLSGADLFRAEVTTAQLNTAQFLHGATMPDGSIHP